MPKIEEIVLEEFRGATGVTRIELEPAKRLALFYGENGTGKSCLIDGLDVALTGEVGSLADVSVGTGARVRYLRSLGAQGTTRAAARIEGKWWVGTVVGQSIVRETPAPPLPVFVLRRRQIQRLIEATDSQKYAVVEPCLGLAGIAKAEDALEKALRNATVAFKAAQERRDGAAKALEALCAAAGGPMGRAVEWAKRLAAEPLDDLKTEAVRLEATERRWDAADEATTAWHAAVREAEAAQVALRAHEAQGVPALGLAPEDAASLASLLQAAHAYVQRHPESCPVCERDAPLLESLDRRLAGLEAVRTHALAGTALRKDVEDRDRRAALRAEGVVLTVGELALVMDDLRGEADAGAAAHALTAVERERRTIASRREALARKLADANGIRTNLRLFEEENARAEALRKTGTCLKAAAEIVAGGRKAYVQGILDEIQGDVARMYAVVHPDEPIAAGTMTLDEAKSGSLRHTVRLGDHEGVAPGPYFSESHQDTLALCILLAVAKRRGGGKAILLLDDVLLSADERHMDRLQTLLAGEMDAFGQIVMTTHHRRFFARFAADGSLADRVELRHLLPYDPAVGIAAGRTVTKAADPSSL